MASRSINGQALKMLPIGLSGIESIRRSEAYVRPIDPLVRRNEDGSRSLELLCDTLLPKLMAGDIDVLRVTSEEHVSRATSEIASAQAVSCTTA